MPEEDVEILAELKAFIEKEIERKQEEANTLRRFLKAVDAFLVKSSFKTADKFTGKREELKVEMMGETLSIKSGNIELATMYIDNKEIRIIPVPEHRFDPGIPPFDSFFVNRIMNNMKDEDQAKVEAGELTQEDAFAFEVKIEDGILEEIIIRNAGSQERNREIQRTIRWTLEKMWEKKESKS
ncbi:MAG: hypothetical protein ACFE7E_00765 [Candidatus Hodarchaeota archaeon]